ncbi:acyl-CoA dehydrogenase family protein [Thermithiobacillus plumbiphilus]|uniref:Acyl-CoA dehydrogenase family protein n=1 Tax=Thermithiobacillus plumbiphilus TaxID=1729899 RepID=A0ABU9DA19_9PROT
MTSPADHLILRQRFAEIARSVVLAEVAAIEDYHWPQKSLQALADSGLLPLAIPKRFGGLGAGMTGMVIAGEELGRISPSASLCYCMHVVGSAVIAAKPSELQVEKYLLPIVQGRHLTTLALSEPGSGGHFYEPGSRLERAGDHYLVHGAKNFVTNGGQADSYVISTLSEQGEAAPGVFNCLMLDRDTSGMEWEGSWRGLGMRGNSSINLHLDGARVPLGNLLGEAGDQNWYVFEVVAPYFLIAMAATYLGLAQGALDLAMDHLKQRRYAHSGQSLAEDSIIQHRLGELWIAVQQARLLIFHAAERGDLGNPDALPFILSAKVAAAEVAVRTTNEALTFTGGSGYRDNSLLWARLRDARAADVMAPLTDVLKTWTGRALLGQPLLS